MVMTDHRWSAIAESPFAWEREALDWLRQQLPNHDPWRAWTNFEFIAEDGSINEIDALILTPAGLFLIEIKSRPGAVDGDAHTWTWVTDGRRHSYDNPLLLANRKSKRLKSLLMRQPSLAKSRNRSLYVEPLIFLSATNLDCRLDERARTSVFLRGQPDNPRDDGIMSALQAIDSAHQRPFTPAQGREIARAMDEAGVRPSNALRRIGDYELGKLLVEGDIHQDYEATHVSLRNNKVRIRIYPYAADMKAERRQALFRAAEREYLLLDGLDHRGILRVKGFTESERGPALIFEHDPEGQRLDHYLGENETRLSIDLRLDLLRQLAEALKYAHEKKIYHRALSPESILIRQDERGRPRIQIFNWQTAGLDRGSEAGRSPTVLSLFDPANRAEPLSRVYLAPELAVSAQFSAAAMDVFSLGTIAYRLFSGQPPADSALALKERLEAGHGLRISDVLDGASENLQILIQFSTHPKVITRITLDEFLDMLMAVEDDFTTPEPERTVDPLEAGKGDRLDHGFTVKARLGRGSTAVALLVERDGDTGPSKVLKVALDDQAARRLGREADALGRLRHPNIVQLHEPLDVGGRRALLMDRAGDRTLAARLRDDGRLGLDLLGRFGEDLLSVVWTLETQGVAHRDIKPENIGIGALGQSGQLRLVLFDFSLTSAAPEDISAGTRPYLDPFLRLRRPPRWDLHAERFAAAMTLHEMATGTLPQWADGHSDPSLVPDEATINPEVFDPAVRDDLVDFFRRALARDITARFDNAEDMLRAWRQIFDALAGRNRGRRVAVRFDLDTFAATAEPNTPIAELQLSEMALSVLTNRLGINTIAEFLARNRREYRYLRGVGDSIRKEIRLTAKRLAASRPDLTPSGAGNGSDEDIESSASLATVDRLSERLVPDVGQTETAEDMFLAAYLGIAETTNGAAADRLPWPSLSEAALLTDLGRSAAGDALIRARARWKKLEDLNTLRAEIAELIKVQGGAMGALELVNGILAARGSTASESERTCLAGAVLRAALEVESARETPRFRLFVLENRRLLVAVDERHADYAAQLGTEADKIAESQPPAAPRRAVEQLRAVVAAEGIAQLGDNRLRSLAVAASANAALSTRFEIYPRGMAPDQAIALAIGSLVGTRTMSVDEVHGRVRGRYPEAAPLPDRPELDGLLRRANADLTWDPDAFDERKRRGAYRPVSAAPASSNAWTTNGVRFSTGHGRGLDADPEALEAARFEERLQHSLQGGGFLALTVPYRNWAPALRELTDTRRFPVAVRSVDTLLIGAMKEEAAAAGVNWNKVMAADAVEPNGKTWGQLMKLVKRSLPRFEAEILDHDQPLLLTDPGLIARYGLTATLDRLRDSAGRPDKVPLLWLLIPTLRPLTAPLIDNLPVPVLGSYQWAAIPEAWIRNDYQRGRAA